MVDVVPLNNTNEKAMQELIKLARDLHGDQRSMTLADLEELVDDKSTILLTLQDEGHIIGMATLYIIPKIGKRNGLLEDVIVDSGYRGQGLGEKLTRAIMEKARELQLSSVTLISGSDREAAHKLYEKLGFKRKETGVFKFSF
jgi:ribosomal protein S18 acetylase RimI-like enzyme